MEMTELDNLFLIYSPEMKWNSYTMMMIHPQLTDFLRRRSTILTFIKMPPIYSMHLTHRPSRLVPPYTPPGLPDVLHHYILIPWLLVNVILCSDLPQKSLGGKYSRTSLWISLPGGHSKASQSQTDHVHSM
jgi:hypothetical protein